LIFFVAFVQELIEDMPDVIFENHVKALAIRRMEKPKKLSSQHRELWGEITSQQYNFNRGTYAHHSISSAVSFIIRFLR
jgi:insulysin